VCFLFIDYNKREQDMTDMLDGGVIRIFRLTYGPGEFGLSCNPDGLFLAGVPLLRRTRAGFVPRPAPEIASLIKAAYGADADQTRLQSRLGAIAQALNDRDFATAMIAAVHTRTPELSPEAALRLTKADGELTKYNFNPNEPRDQHGRWTRDGSSDSKSLAASGIEGDQRVDPHASDQRQRVAENASGAAIDAPTLSDNVGAVDVAMGDDIMRSIVKNACIAECSESSLPTHDYGWDFVKCVNECMRRHGHDPHLFRPS
jgi:hypothetical protein